MSEANIVYGKSANSTGPVVTIGTNADKTYTSADLAAAEEQGRREVMKILNEVRWHFDHDFTSDVDSYVCGGCRKEKSDPENHAPYCEVGKLFALLDAKEAGDE